MKYDNLKIIKSLQDLPLENISNRDTVFTGVRPSNNGNLHIGHLKGFGENTRELEKYFAEKIYIIVADYQAISDKPHKEGIQEVKMATENTIIDVISMIGNPQNINIFKETDVLDEISILKNLLEQYCTIDDVYNDKNYFYKDLNEQKNKNINKGKDNNISLLLYQLGQIAQIIGAGEDNHRVYVPSGPDQNDVSNLGNIVMEKFGKRYNIDTSKIVSICEEKEIIGVNGKKMGKSENNTINLGDDISDIKQKIYQINDRNVFVNYGETFFDTDFVKRISKNLTLKEIEDLRSIIYNEIVRVLTPIQEKQQYYRNNRNELEKVLAQGLLSYKNQINRNISKFKGIYLDNN